MHDQKKGFDIEQLKIFSSDRILAQPLSTRQTTSRGEQQREDIFMEKANPTMFYVQRMVSRYKRVVVK